MQNHEPKSKISELKGRLYQWTIFPDAHPITNKGPTWGTLKQGTFDDFKKDIQKYAWSPFIFTNNYRIGANWLSCDFLVADYDSGTPTLAQAIAKVLPFKHIIGTTKSHQKIKEDKPAVDRFRVALPLHTSITVAKEYKNLWKRFALYLPGLDAKCKDLARFYWPIVTVTSENSTAPSIENDNLPSLPPTYISVSKLFFKKSPSRSFNSNPPNPNLGKGRLSKRTQTFLAQGSSAHQWHDEFRFAAKDLKAQNYSEQEAETLLKKVTGSLTSKDEYQIYYAYNLDSQQFNYRPITIQLNIQEGLKNENR